LWRNTEFPQPRVNASDNNLRNILPGFAPGWVEAEDYGSRVTTQIQVAKDFTMARSWLKYVAILASLVAGTVCSTALADGGRLSGGIRVGGNSGGGFNRGSVSPRMGGNSGGNNGSIMRTPAPRVTNGNVGGNVGGNFGGQVLNKTGGTVLTKPPVNAGPKLPIVSKLPVVGGGNGGGGGGVKIGSIADKGGGLKINPIGGKIGGGKIGDGKIGGGISIFPKGPILGHKDNGHSGGHGHGGHSHISHCDPFKPGCHPWWFCPSWVAPAPVVYTEPIIIPVSVPAAPIVVASQPATSPSMLPTTEGPAATETAKPVTTTTEEKIQQVPLGATLTLQAKELGEQAGQVIIQIEKIAMPALVSDWSASSVTATLPTVAIAENLRAELLLVKADGQVASSVKIELTPALPPVTEDAKLAGDPASALLPAALNP
jgi:hypothetical protein